MMATDSSGKQVAFGDYVAVTDQRIESLATFVSTIARIIKLEEGTKGIKAIGACVILEGNGRVGKFDVDLAHARLVMKSDGSLVS